MNSSGRIPMYICIYFMCKYTSQLQDPSSCAWSKSGVIPSELVVSRSMVWATDVTLESLESRRIEWSPAAHLQSDELRVVDPSTTDLLDWSR